MPRISKLLIAAAALCLAALGCDQSGPRSSETARTSAPPSTLSVEVQPKGDRILELDANPSQVGDYDQAMMLARQLGAESIRLSVYWDEIESVPGKFDPDPNWLAIANQYYSAQGFSISLVISVLDTTEVRLASDLDGRSFSDPEISTRFQKLLDYVHSQLPDVELISLAIGNEIDGVLGDDQTAWQEYQVFYESAAGYARELWPSTPVSTKVTFEGLTNANAGAAREMYRNSPVVMTTYYPLQGDFTVKDPGVILDDFTTLTEIFPNKEIHITEIGYPTSQTNQSSEEKQAQFIRAMFQAWDAHADQITVLSYSWLSDLPDAAVGELESYYGLANPAFGEFLRTLGLRTYPGEGENKIGFDTFQAEAEARGW